jgi:hypothetical protein
MENTHTHSFLSLEKEIEENEALLYYTHTLYIMCNNNIYSKNRQVSLFSLLFSLYFKKEVILKYSVLNRHLDSLQILYISTFD